MTRCFYPAKVLLLGLFIAQILATTQVYLSNDHLYHSLSAIQDAGYLAIPNQLVMHSLQEFGPAFFGGLFFTLTVGAGLTLFSIATAWLWDRLLRRKKLALILFLLPLMACLVGINRRGFCPMVTSYVLVIPPVVFFATLRWMPPRSGQGGWVNRMFHFIPIALLAVLWACEVDSQIFVDLRDNLLLSNSLGTKINDFYYKYTLYPAEVFKSLDQKILKTCDLHAIQKRPMARSLERQLLNHDYLHVGGNVPADLNITVDGKNLVFESKEKAILRTTPQDFFSNPGRVLKEFSLRTDKHIFFRQLTFVCLFIGFPLTLYVIVYALFRFVLCFFLQVRTASAIASILCFLIGITLLAIFYHGRQEKIEVRDLAEALKSKRWQERVAALKIIEQKGMEVSNFEPYRSMLTSPHIPERYWLVRALGVSRQPETYQDLLAFLNDPHPNVVSMAFSALGRRGDRSAVEEILERFETSDNWYNQRYAYKALRSLGWKQTKSN